MGNYYMVHGLASKSAVQRKGENILHNNTSESMTSKPTKEMPKYKSNSFGQYITHSRL